MLMRWPSGSALATYFAATTPPAPRRFSTMTGWPRLAESFSVMSRAIVSEAAAPGVTPETRRTVLFGKFCACAWKKNAMPKRKKTAFFKNMKNILLYLRQPELRCQPVGRAAAVPVGPVVGIVTPIFHHEELDRAGD